MMDRQGAPCETPSPTLERVGLGNRELRARVRVCT
jgi:hypothetical protein